MNLRHHLSAREYRQGIVTTLHSNTKKIVCHRDMSLVSDNYYRQGLTPDAYDSIKRSTLTDGPLNIPRFRLGATSAADLRSQLKPTGDLYMATGLTQEKLDMGQQTQLRPQAYKDQSADTRDGLASFFATPKITSL